MPRRILKSVPRSAGQKPKTPRPVEGKRGSGLTKHAVRDSAAERVERTAVKSQPVPVQPRSVPATQAKNRFGEILQMVRDSGPVFIERHGQAQAVVLGIDAYDKLVSNERSSQERELDYWRREFDALHARMQTRKARQAADALFCATDAELNRKDS